MSGRTSDRRGTALITVKDFLWFIYLYPFRLLAAIAPRGLLYRLVDLCDPLIQFRSRKRRRMAAGRMAAAGVAREHASRFVSNAALRIIDDLAPVRKLRCTSLEGIEHLSRARSAGRGVIVLSAHFYASRIARRYLAAIGYPMLTVRNRRPPDELMGVFGRRFLQPRYMEFLHRVIQDEVDIQDPECTLQILQRLRRGGLVNIHFDGPFGARTVELPFLNMPRRFATGVLDLIRLQGCAVVPMLCLGRSTGFRIIFSPAVDIVEAPALVRILEQQISAYPEEWELWTRL